MVNLSELKPGARGVVLAVRDAGESDPIARRLRELGFVAGEEVHLVTTGPFGREPLLVEVGYTRFALRRSEAARIEMAEAA